MKEGDKQLIHLELAFVFLTLGFLILLDQFLKVGEWFQLKDLHHETFALAFFALAFGILVGKKLK